MIDNINPYNAERFKSRFQETDLYKKICRDFGTVSFNSYYVNDNEVTIRQQLYDRSLPTEFSVVPFYYLEYLTAKNPQNIYDLGCGWNVFKRYIPSIIGIGAETKGSKYFFGDVHDFVDNDFIENHQGIYESVFSINALHFRPLEELRQMVLEFSSMIKSKGTGFLTANLTRMLSFCRDENLKKCNLHELDKWIRMQLIDMPFKYEVLDIDISVPDEYLNGNIRMVISK